MWIKRRCAELEKRSIKPFRTGWGLVEAVRGCRLLRLLRSDRIGHDRATLAKGLIRTDRRIARGLMFNLGIEFGRYSGASETGAGAGEAPYGKKAEPKMR